MSDRQVTLKNGTREHAPLVVVVTEHLNSLINIGMGIVVYELVEMCRDANHKPFGSTGDELKARYLVEEIDGLWRVHESTKNIVLLAVSGEGLDLTVGDPIKRDEPSAVPT